jgi:hypothetical protein
VRYAIVLVVIGCNKTAVRAVSSMSGSSAKERVDGTPVWEHDGLGVVLDSTRIRYTAAGADLRFSDAGGMPLPYEIESWNPSGKSFA